MTWNLMTFLVLLAVLFAGYGIGLLEMHLRRRKKIAFLEQELKAHQSRPEPAPVPVPTSAPAAPGLLRLWTDEDESLKMEVDGAALDSPASTTPEQRRRLITLLNGIRPWIEAGPVAPVARVPAPSAPLPVSPAPSSAPVKLADPSLVSPGARSIVSQVNDILQARMVGTPLAARRIRLVETPSGGALVYIGSNRYESVDVVPDPEVVAAIRAATAEWEQSIQ